MCVVAILEKAEQLSIYADHPTHLECVSSSFVSDHAVRETDGDLEWRGLENRLATIRHRWGLIWLGRIIQENDVRR
jgi:hypothetical protein